MNDRAIKKIPDMNGRNPGPGTPFLINPCIKEPTRKRIPNPIQTRLLIRSRFFMRDSFILSPLRDCVVTSLRRSEAIPWLAGKSHKSSKIIRLPRCLRSLAMTNQDYDTASQGERIKPKGLAIYRPRPAWDHTAYQSLLIPGAPDRGVCIPRYIGVGPALISQNQGLWSLFPWPGLPY